MKFKGGVKMQRQKRIMAIHDISCVGRCSLTVALPILSAAGFDTGVLPTAILSTHTGGFEGFTYRDLTEDIEPIKAHYNTLGLKFDALYSGFLGSYQQIDLVKNFFLEVKSEDGLTVVDPVMGDNGKLYSIYTDEMAQGMVRLCSVADIIVPNLTEASLLLGEDYKGDDYDKEYIEKTLRKLSKLGPNTVIITGVSFEEGKLGAACYDKIKDEVSYVSTKKIEGHFHGTGDIFSSALLGGILNGFSINESAKIAADFTVLAIEKCIELDCERRYGVPFEKALPNYIKSLNLV